MVAGVSVEGIPTRFTGYGFDNVVLLRECYRIVQVEDQGSLRLPRCYKLLGRHAKAAYLAALLHVYRKLGFADRAPVRHRSLFHFRKGLRPWRIQAHVAPVVAEIGLA